MSATNPRARSGERDGAALFLLKRSPASSKKPMVDEAGLLECGRNRGQSPYGTPRQREINLAAGQPGACWKSSWRGPSGDGAVSPKDFSC